MLMMHSLQVNFPIEKVLLSSLSTMNHQKKKPPHLSPIKAQAEKTSTERRHIIVVLHDSAKQENIL